MIAATPDRPRTRVEPVMGTAFGISVADAPTAATDRAVDDAFSWLRWVDTTFSTYRAGSEVRRLDRGELALDDASPEVREVLVRCAELTDLTDGWFRIHAPATSERGQLDPSGLVKGWSIDRAVQGLRMAGIRSCSVNGGGDLVCTGHPSPGRGWRVGIRHPHDPAAVAAVLDVSDLAVATSATYERGAHIWGGRRGLASVTVAGPELGTVDALATALFAEGSGHPAWLDRFPGHHVLAITDQDRMTWTEGFDRLLATPDDAGDRR